jgi:hypothetical protein
MEIALQTAFSENAVWNGYVSVMQDSATARNTPFDFGHVFTCAHAHACTRNKLELTSRRLANLT